MKRDFNADFLNQLLNDRSIIRGSRLEGVTDLSLLVKDTNVILTYEEGAFLVINKGASTYEVHTMALKEGRGKVLRENIAKAMEYMFFNTDCVRLITSAFKDNPASVALSKEYFRLKGENEEAYYYELRYGDWITDCDIARDEGERFHEQVEVNHSKDDTHDSNVGGAILLLKNGNVGKGVTLYNEWAKMSGYELITVLNVTPLIMQIGEMKVIYHNQVLEEICQQ